jgi:hypothetical protein
MIELHGPILNWHHTVAQFNLVKSLIQYSTESASRYSRHLLQIADLYTCTTWSCHFTCHCLSSLRIQYNGVDSVPATLTNCDLETCQSKHRKSIYHENSTCPLADCGPLHCLTWKTWKYWPANNGCQGPNHSLRSNSYSMSWQLWIFVVDSCTDFLARCA